MNLYVGNLSGEIKEDDLKKAFEVFGELESVNIIRDKLSGESRGFGFVEMRSNDEGQAAIKGLNGTDLKNLPITVNEARPRSDRQGSRRQ